MTEKPDEDNDQPDQEDGHGKNDTNHSLEEDFEALQEEYEELENQLKRTHADFQNYKKRVQRRKEQRQDQAIRSLVEDLLPYLDNQELTLNEADDYESLRESVELNHDQLLDILEDHGLEEIQTDGRFNPQQHEATLTKDTDNKDKHNHIINELRKGYKLGDHVLRHAQVSIAQHTNDTDSNEPTTPKEETHE